MLPALLIAASIVPVPDSVVRETVDCVERNAFFDDGGRLVFIQQIFIGFTESGDEQIIAWRLEKQLDQQVQRDHARKGWVIFWQDQEQIREVFCRTMRETFLQYDPELEARTKLPKDQRRELKTYKGYR